MYRPDKYMHRPVGVPYQYEKDRARPKRKKMFKFYESSFHTVQPTELPKVPNRWVSEIKDNYVYFVTEKKSPNQPYRHNYDMYDPLRTTIKKFVPHVPVEHAMPLERVVPPKDRRPHTAPMYHDHEEYEYVRKSGGGQRRKKGQRRKEQPRKRRSVEVDVEERKPIEALDEREMPPDRKKVFTKAEDTKFHSNMTLEERSAEQRDKAIERLKRKAFDGVKNVEPTFVLPKGSRPEFCNYGHGNINPIRDEDYMKSYNIKAGKVSELHDYITTRRARTHGYTEWKKYMGSTPTNFQPTDTYKKRKLTRPKTPPRMHKAKQEGYQGVSHYFNQSKGGIIGEEGQQKKKMVKKRKKSRKKKKKKDEEDEEEQVEISPRKQGPPKPQPQPQYRGYRRRKRINDVAPSRGNLRKYMDEELEEVIEHGSNVSNYYDEEDDDGEVLVHPRNETMRRLTKITGGNVYSFQPKTHNNEDWDPKNYKCLPNEYTCFIRSAGVRTSRDRDKSVSQAMKQFE